MVRTEGRAAFMPCEPRNVSIGGICLRLEEDVELRSEVEVELVAANLPQPLHCHGRVNWTTARLDVRAQPPIPYDVGIEFIGLSSELREELQRAIEVFRQRAIVTPSSNEPVIIRLGELALTAYLNTTATARALLHTLPLETTVHRWGDEIYCAAPVVGATAESPTQDVRVGDLGYWIEGQSLCLFFGRTPTSVDDAPRPIVPVNLVGRFTLDERLRSVHDGTPVHMARP